MQPLRNKLGVLVISGLAIAALGAVLWLRSASRERPLDVDLSAHGAVPAGPKRSQIRFAIAPILSPERTVNHYYALVSYLAVRLNRPVKLVQRRTYTEVNELLRLGAVQAAIVCTGAYVRARIDRIPVEAIAVPVYPAGPVYHSLLIVRADSAIKSLDDLRGRRFAFSDPLSLSGHFYPTSLLLQRGLEPARFFSQTMFTYSHDGSLRAVLDGIADGAAVDSIAYDIEVSGDPGLGAQVRVIHRSPPLTAGPVVVPAASEPAARGALQRVLTGMQGRPEGRKVLSALGVVRFDLPAPASYERETDLVARVMRGLDR